MATTAPTGDFHSKFLEEFVIVDTKCFEKGAFGVLFLVKSKDAPESAEPSVIKVIQGFKKEDFSYTTQRCRPLSSQEAERFPKEKNLEHPNIIKIIESWVEKPPKGYCYVTSQIPVKGSDGVLFIQMEWCDLKSLRIWLDSPWKNIKDCWKVLYQVTLGLEYLHGREVTHRDLKPANILLKYIKQDDGRDTVIVKIADFGEATDLKKTMTGMRGTKGYRHLAEQIAVGEKRHWTAQADMWSLGIILSEMIIRTKNANLYEEFKTITRDEGRQLPPFKPREPRWNMTETEIAWAEKMIHGGEVVKITCEEFRKELKAVNPEADEFIELWDENPFVVDVTGNSTALKSYPEINPLKFKTITDLRLEYVEVNIADLMSSMQACEKLVNITLIIKAMSNNGSQSYENLKLQTVKSFTLHQLNDFKGYTTVDQVSSQELRDMLFFGQTSLIATNSMKVKVQLKKADLIDIDLNEENFIVNGKASRFLIDDVLFKTNPNQFKVISINNLGNTSVDSLPLELDDYFSNTPDELKLERLELHKTVFNLEYMPFLKRAKNLKTLYLDGSIGNVEKAIINFADFPGSLDTVTLKYFTVNISSEPKSFKTLQLVYCNIPKDFAELYQKWLEVSDLLTIVPISNSEFHPSLNLANKVIDKEWKEMRFGGFDRDFKIEDENYSWWKDLMKNISGTDIKIVWRNQDAVVQEYLVQNDDCVQGSNEDIKIRIQSTMTDFDF